MTYTFYAWYTKQQIEHYKEKLITMRKIALALVGLLISCVSLASADERFFTYSYEANVLPEGTWEYEQWITNQNGKEQGDYSEWNLRSEFEYGLTERLTTALYLNLDSTRADGVEGEESETKFKGISSEWLYQLVNPNLNPVGVGLYGEVSTDGIDLELEGKLLFSQQWDEWVAAANLIYEAEWEKEDGETEKEAVFEQTVGLAYRITPQWSLGLEARHKAAYPDGLNLSGREFQTVSVGPNIHYGAPKWWATLTVMPQVWGDGDGAESNRNLVHEESVETRLIFGVFF